MIKPGVWYRFKSENDKKAFIKEAIATFVDTLDHISEQDKAELLTKEALRVTPHGHHIGYRTNVNLYYMSTTLYEGDNKMNRDDVRICGTCTTDWTCEGITDALVRKYYEKEKQTIFEETKKAIQKVREESDVYQSLTEFYKLAKEREVKVMIDIGNELLSEEDRAKIKALETERDKKRQKAFDKAFECCRLLEKTHAVIEYKSILDIYGYIQEAPISIKSGGQ